MELRHKPKRFPKTAQEPTNGRHGGFTAARVTDGTNWTAELCIATGDDDDRRPPCNAVGQKRMLRDGTTATGEPYATTTNRRLLLGVGGG
ncbi:hypothetical protein HPB50_003120 [Hyalomma asiaticum]|uniref:Uncharacterized protein n=1 Tax=Hyalomma asiaticum TaxID=266040 RepID=A0ACB7S3Z0_HYAAI|nr:hypothetical protein HPB50_003120 [Hyalomma asiaticum]